MFHVSVLCFNLLIINAFNRWNIALQCFIFSFNVSFQKTLWEKNKNTVGAIQKHCGSGFKTLRERESTPSVFWKMKHETKNETLKSYVSLFEMIDIQLLYNKKWNMKDKSKALKTYRDFVR